MKPSIAELERLIAEYGSRNVSIDADGNVKIVTAYIPGIWRCSKCDFELVSNSIHAATGAVSANTKQPVDGCPNCETALEPVTWESRCEYFQELYMDLIMQVATCFPDESRHDTAKRYIMQREQPVKFPQGKDAVN